MVRHAYIKIGIPVKANQRGSFFTGVCYSVANQILSLDDVEHGIIRSNTRHPYHLHKQFVGDDPRRAWAVSKLDPRIHFTLFCGANSCPPINSYTVEDLENELQLAAEAFCQEDSNVLLDEVGRAGLYFLSDLSRGVTGEIHYVDGGYNVVGIPSPRRMNNES